MKKPLILLVAVAAVTLAAWTSWRLLGDRDNTDELVLHGNVDIRQIALAFEGSGRVASLHAEEGDHVKAGTVLAELDTRTLTLQAEQAQALVEVQRQVVSRLRSGSRPQELSQARSRLTAAETDAARAKADFERLRILAGNTQGRGVSAQDLDHAARALQVADARVAEQRDALRLTELGPRAEDVTGARAQLQAAEAQLALLKHQIAQGKLEAPADAVIRSRLLEPGDMATPQKPVFALALTQPKWVRVYVGEPDLSRITSGMPARVVTDGQPDKPIMGKVGYISSVAEFTPKSVQTEELRTSLVYEVRVLVEDPDDVLRLGQPATVHVTRAAAK